MNLKMILSIPSSTTITNPLSISLGPLSPSIPTPSQPIPMIKAVMVGRRIHFRHQTSNMFQTMAFITAYMINLIQEILLLLIIQVSTPTATLPYPDLPLITLSTVNIPSRIKISMLFQGVMLSSRICSQPIRPSLPRHCKIIHQGTNRATRSECH